MNSRDRLERGEVNVARASRSTSLEFGRLARIDVRICWALVFLLFAAGRGIAENLADRFDQANRLYEQAKYAEAISAYQALLQQNHASAALYFNLGNAWFKSGKTGQAIVFYRLAQRLQPRDPDVRANLRFARESVIGNTSGARRWERWLSVLTLNELTLLTAAVLWLWFSLLTAAQIQRRWARTLRTYQVVAGLLVAVTGVWFGLVLQKRLGHSTAVVVAPEAVVRYGPFEEAQSFYTLRDGAELTVLDRKESWFQVSDGSNRTGWMQDKDVVVLPRG